MVCTIPICGQFAALLVSTDFTDDTPLNSLQLALYGFQQSVVGLGADVGDLLAASRDLRSFDKEDAESDAGKVRAQKLVKDYFEDYAQNAAVTSDETDMFGTPPLTREEMMRHFRENGRDAGPRFSVNPNLRADIDAALNTDPAKGAVVKGGKRVVFGRSQRLFPALGLPDGDIYSKAYALRKIANYHNLTAEQLAAAPSLMEEPAAVFDDNGNGYVFLTDAIASDRNGVGAPVMFYIRPDGEGNYIASAYSRTEDAESKYVNLANARKVLYWDKSKIARLPLRGEALSSLITFSAGDSVATPEGLTLQSVSQTGAPAQGARYSIAGRGGAANLGLKGAAEAEAMEKSGADREDIWRTTGWWRGRDGKWRVEIPDAKRLGFKGDLRTRHFDGHTSFRLNELVYADALEKAYPEMFGDGSGMVLIHVNDDTGFTAAYSPSLDTIEIPRNMLITGKYADGKDWAHLSESGLSMVVHEIQHAIQKRERFATGADGRYTDYDTYRRTTGEVEARNVQTRLGMTLEERAATPPWETEDVAEDSQIVRYSVAAPLVEAMRNRQRYSISGIYTGTAADYANRSRQGGVDDGPSVKKIGTGEGAQVYGWGLYGSTERGVAEGYAQAGLQRKHEITHNGKAIQRKVNPATAKELAEAEMISAGDVKSAGPRLHTPPTSKKAGKRHFIERPQNTPPTMPTNTSKRGARISTSRRSSRTGRRATRATC